MDFNFIKSNDIGILTLNGELDSRHADDFKSALMICLHNSDRVFVNFEGVSELDNACIRMFCIARKNSGLLKKRFIFDAERFKQRIKQRGVLCSFGCDMFHGKTCLLTQP